MVTLNKIKNLLEKDKAAKERKRELIETSGLGFTKHEKEILYSIYIGDSNSPYFKMVNSFEKKGGGVYVDKNPNKFEENFLSRQIGKTVLGKLQSQGLDNRHGSGGRSDIIGIVEDAFRRAINGYQIPPESNLREELLKKEKDKNYVMERKCTNHFNSFLGTTVKYALINFIRKDGKYEVVDTVKEEVRVTDKFGNTKIVNKETDVIKYVVNKNSFPVFVSIPVGEPDENSDDVGDYVEINKYESMNSENYSIEKYLEEEERRRLREKYEKCLDKMSNGEKILLRNSPELCEVLNRKMLLQSEIAKIIGVSQGNVNGLIKEAFNKFIGKVSVEE